MPVSEAQGHMNRVTYMLIHVAWNIRDVEIGIALVRELLKFGIERFLPVMSVDWQR
jgi:hypothetical protein